MRKALIGNGGHAREVMAQMGIDLVRFVDDQYVNPDTFPLSKFDPDKYSVMVSISDPEIRSNIVQRLPKETRYFSFVHPTALILDRIEIGEGSFIGAYSILTSNIKLGNHSILNRGNQIGHDCIIGDYFSAMPGSIVSGNVHIGDRVYLGTNSSVIENKTISHGIKIGANSVVIRDLNEPGIYVGVPTKKVK